MRKPEIPDNARLLAFNQHVIDQALALVGAYEGQQSTRFAGPVGSHLRHVVEHYEALLFPRDAGLVDYDSRLRSKTLETDPNVAANRLRSLRAQLTELPAAHLDAPVQVLGLAGTAGEFSFAVPSSISRELVFLASHAVHHYALLAAHCQAQGIHIPADFGKAPATVAHERAQERAQRKAAEAAQSFPPIRKETPCLTTLQA
jgi:hypothetical protein